jgi:plastocyanin
MSVDSDLELEDRLRARLRQLNSVEITPYAVLRDGGHRDSSSMPLLFATAGILVAIVIGAQLFERVRETVPASLSRCGVRATSAPGAASTPNVAPSLPIATANDRVVIEVWADCIRPATVTARPGQLIQWQAAEAGIEPELVLEDGTPLGQVRHVLEVRLTQPGTYRYHVRSAPGVTGTVVVESLGTRMQLLPGTLVEIIGHDGYREASTARVRVKLDDARLSAALGDPVLLEADARTQIEPTSPNIAATGVKVGAPVRVSFDPQSPKTSSGAFLLTQFVVVSDGRLPDCLVELDITNPSPGPVPGTGAMSAEEAFRRSFPQVTDFKMFPGASGADSLAPVWIVAASGETYIAHILGATGAPNNWYAFPARFVRCHNPQEVRDRQLTPGAPPGSSPRPDGTRG